MTLSYINCITDWVKIHPGGEVIKYGLGKDATEIFKSVGHKEDALEYVNKYYIGVLHS
jgi:cytochrome b involved in lipid metabolism